MKYHKIQTVFKRDPETNFKTLLEGEHSLPEFKYLRHTQWELSEKVDGMNLRVMYSDEGITFGGRTDRAQIPAQLLNKLNGVFLPKKQILKNIFQANEVCLYGEGYGAGIQKSGKDYSDYQDFILFDILVGDWWLAKKDVLDIASQLEIDVVPTVRYGTLDDMVDLAKNGFVSAFGDFRPEGIVARPTTELRGRDGRRIITKIKCSDFSRL
jgi:hypothetical protein